MPYTDLNAPKSFHHGNLREALILQASALIAERKSVDFTLREVAQRAGVSHTAAYRHFKSKTYLLMQVAINGFNDLSAHIAGAIEKADSENIVATIHCMGQAYLEYADKNAGYYRTLFHPDLCSVAENKALTEASERAILTLVEGLSTAKAQGVLKIEAPCTLIATAMWAALHGYATLRLDHQISDDPDNTVLPQASAAVLFQILNTSLFGTSNL